jgi:hypothetical protein
MALLKHLKRQIDQFVQPDIQALNLKELQIYPNSDPSTPDVDIEVVEPQQKKEKAPREPLTNYEVQYSQAYSHGLEQVYALENVDIRSIKTITPKAVEKDEFYAAEPVENHSIDPQLCLSLEDKFCATMDSFVLLEPIHFLSLSRHAEQCLKDQGITTLRDLIEVDWSKLVFVKGMGQGHIDEIRQRLKEYLRGRAVKQCQTIDLHAWVRSLVPTDYKKKAYALLEAYDLHELISLTPAESVDVQRLTLEKKQEWREEALECFQRPEQRKLFLENLQKVGHIFLKPWVLKRNGIVKGYELVERLERICHKERYVHRIIAFFKDVYMDGQELFDCQFSKVEEGLYCADEAIAKEYYKVIVTAQSYFSKSTTSYKLAMLVSLIERELGAEWNGFQEGFVEKVLRSTSLFRLGSFAP